MAEHTEVKQEHATLTRRVDEHEPVGTVDVQILLSWFFETANPAELPFDVGGDLRAA